MTQNTLDQLIDEDIVEYRQARNEAMAECPGCVRAIKVATYNAVINILINATGNTNDDYKLELVEIAHKYLELMQIKINIINQ